MTTAPSHLMDLLNLSSLQHIQDSIAGLYDMNMMIVDPQGMPLTRTSNRGDGCRLFSEINDHEICLGHCQLLAASGAEMGKSISGHCPNGGITAAIPIVIDGVSLGSWLLCLSRERIFVAGGQALNNAVGELARTFSLDAEPLPDDGKDLLSSMLRGLTDSVVAMTAKDDKSDTGVTKSDKRQEILEIFSRYSDDAMYICDHENGILLMVNEAYCQQVGQPADQIIGRQCKDVNGLSTIDHSPLCPRKTPLEANNTLPMSPVWEYYNEKFGLWLRCKHHNLTLTDGRQAHMVVQRDISQERIMMEQLERLAFFDPQTALPNKHSLIKDLEDARTHEADFPRSFICLYLSSLHMFMDLHGQATEKEILKVLVHALRNANLGEQNIYCLGRDEFCLEFRDCQTAEVEAVAQRIQNRFNDPWEVRLGDNDLSFIGSVSISVLHFSSNKLAPQEIVNLITRSLSKARTIGGLFVYDSAADKQRRDHIRLELDLKQCVKKDMQGFAVHLQPIVEIKSGTWKGVEVLCRWTSKEFGPVSPLVFIHEAERQGLILRIGLWVLEEGIRICKEMGFDKIDGFFMSVNISPLQIMDKHFAGQVTQLLERYEYPGNKLNLEVTESMEITFSNFTRSIIDELRDKGIKMSLDDFGTGYSSFNSLKQLPVDFLKTEKDFINGIEDDSYMQYFFYIMSEISHASNMKLIAEGIETLEQLRVVKNNGADYIQGYFFSKPLPPDLLRENLENFFQQDEALTALNGENINIRQWLSGKNAYELTPNLFMLLNQCIQILLSEAEFTTAIEDVLEIVGEHFGVSRAFVFLQTGVGLYSNLFEWCAQGVESEKNKLMDLDLHDDTPTLFEMFSNDGMVVASDLGKLPFDMQKTLGELDVKAVALLPIWDEDVLAGFVGFDKTSYYEWSPEEIIMLWNLGMIMLNSIKRERLRTEVIEKDNMLDSVLRTSGLSSFISDIDTDEILWVNEVLKNSKDDGDTFIGRKCYDVFYGRNERCPECKKPELLSSPSGQASYEVHNEHWDRIYMVYETLMPWIGGKRAHVGYALDITEQKKMQERLEYYVSRDILTGALNRNRIMQAMEELWLEARKTGHSFALAVINIHNMKQINARHGHDAGDQVLAMAVKSIRICTQKADLVGRISGDEFMVLFPRCTKGVAKVRMIESRNYFAQSRVLPGEEKLSFSFGVADSTEYAGEDTKHCCAELLKLAGQRNHMQNEM
ncbi:EAL domain-containing protein [Desulfovibrio sp. OttesenSCG-928-F20]|nr:EAL domain-containing protein [Desulfovibrio sp. OttesenSCG-928-F20]